MNQFKSKGPDKRICPNLVCRLVHEDRTDLIYCLFLRENVGEMKRVDKLLLLLSSPQVLGMDTSKIKKFKPGF